MALDETQRKTIYEGDGTVTQFAFSFVVFQPSDIAVYSSTDGGDTESALTFEQDYTVALNSDQDNAPGGTVTLVKAPASGTRIAILSNIPETQPMVLTTHDGFDPRVLNKSADHAVALIQQLTEKVDRAIAVPTTSSKTSGQFRTEILNLAANAESWANTSASSASAAAQSAADAKDTLATIKTETDTQIDRLTSSGDVQLQKIESAAADAVANIKAPAIAISRVTTRLISDLPAGTSVSVPTHVVNSSKLQVFLDGVLCLPAEQYTDATVSTITFVDTIPAGHEITAIAYINATDPSDDMTAYIQALGTKLDKAVYEDEKTAAKEAVS